VTIGANLTPTTTADAVSSCIPPSSACTLANTALPVGQAAADGVASPISGVVVRWSVISGSNPFSARLRVIRGQGVVVLGETVSINSSGRHDFPARLSINAGDVMAVDLFNFQPLMPPLVTAGAPPDNARSFEQWNDPPDAGDMGPPTMTNMASEVLVSAVVEPDADGDGYGDETQDGCPTDPSTHGPCPPPPTNTGGTTGTPGSGSPGGTPGTGGSSGAGSGSTLGGALPNGPPIVTAPPPLPTPKTTKKKAKRCKRAKRGHRAKRCPKKKRSARRR
jgi:uncharacterized membrane protein YgcG